MMIGDIDPEAENIRIKKTTVKKIKKKYKKDLDKLLLDTFDKEDFKDWEKEVLDWRWDDGRS